MIRIDNMLAITAAVSSSDYDAQASLFWIVSIVAFALAVLCLVFAAFAFIKFKIPKIIGDLSGRNAKKSIAQMRAENEKTGKKSFRPHPVAKERGPLTDTIDNLPKEAKVAIDEKNGGESNSPTEEDFDNNATEKLNYDSNGTEVLSEGTQVLSTEMLNEAVQQHQDRVEMIMLQDIVFVHTDETI